MILSVVLILAGCGGGGDGDAGDDSSGGGSGEGTGSGEVVDRQLASQATASVDGQEFTFDTPGLADCSVESDTFTFSFVIGDNEVGLAGG